VAGLVARSVRAAGNDGAAWGGPNVAPADRCSGPAARRCAGRALPAEARRAPPAPDPASVLCSATVANRKPGFEAALRLRAGRQSPAASVQQVHVSNESPCEACERLLENPAMTGETARNRSMDLCNGSAQPSLGTGFPGLPWRLAERLAPGRQARSWPCFRGRPEAQFRTWLGGSTNPDQAGFPDPVGAALRSSAKIDERALSGREPRIVRW